MVVTRIMDKNKFILNYKLLFGSRNKKEVVLTPDNNENDRRLPYVQLAHHIDRQGVRLLNSPKPEPIN